MGFFVFFSLDSAKVWNPYGWWFIATLILTIIGGLSGLIEDLASLFIKLNSLIIFLCSSSIVISDLLLSKPNRDSKTYYQSYSLLLNFHTFSGFVSFDYLF